MSDGQVKKYSARLYFLECPALFGNRTSRNLGILVRRTSEHFKIFFTPVVSQGFLNILPTNEMHLCQNVPKSKRTRSSQNVPVLKK